MVPAAEESGNPRQSICLVTALTVADFIDPDIIADAHTNTGAQLGVLTLAALLREHGLTPVLVNLDDLFFEYIRGSGAGAEYYFSFVVRHLRSLSFDVFGLSSICSSYPLTLRLAEEIRQMNASATIILGGPQASVVDVATMRAFPCVDVIVRGEADDTLPALLQLHRSGDARWQNLPGITFRRGNDVIRNQNAPVVEELDRLPLPSFDLDLRIREREGIHLEIGRGCPFVCTFCSTNDFFRRNFRLKSPARMIADISTLKNEYGLTYFSLVHDMYTIDRKKVEAFCESILTSGEQFTWGCSARTDCIDDDLLDLMGRAGCTGIFFGIETGSQRMQAVINKNLDLVEAVKRIECANRNSIHMAVALIVGFPEETRDDLRDTIHFFVDVLRFEHAEPQCSLLAPLAATPIYEKYKDSLIFDDIFSDMSHQSWRQDPVEKEMIRAHPSVFPNFYAIPTVVQDRKYVKEVVDFVTYLATWFRWLPVGLCQDSGDVLKVFDRWRKWRLERQPVASDEDTGWTPYYSHRRFRSELLEFVRTCYLPEFAEAPPAISALVQVEDVSSHEDCTPIINPVDRFDEDSIPYRLQHFRMLEFDVDYSELIRALKSKSALTEVSNRKTTVIFAAGDDRLDVWQLPPLSAILMSLCDGGRRVNDIARDFRNIETDLDGIPAEAACLFGLTQLRDDGLIGLGLAGSLGNGK